MILVAPGPRSAGGRSADLRAQVTLGNLALVTSGNRLDRVRSADEPGRAHAPSCPSSPSTTPWSCPGTSVTFPVTSTSRPRRSTAPSRGASSSCRASRAPSRRTASWPSVVGEVTLPDGTRGVAVEALHRAELGPAVARRAGLRVSAHELPDPDEPAPRPPPWRASTAPWSRRSPTLRGDRARSPASSRASPTRAAWPTRPATPRRSPSTTKPELLETVDVVDRLRMAIGPSASAWPTPPCASGSARTSPRAWTRASARCSCAASSTPSARSSARTTRPGDDWADAHRRGRACPRRRGRRPSASWAAWSASPTAPRPG